MPTVLFTRDTARDMQARSATVQKEKWQRIKEARNKPADPPQPCELSDHLELIREQIARARMRLNSDDITDKDRAALLRAIDALIERERILRQIPGPPKFAGSPPRFSQRREMPRVEPQPVVSPPPPTEPQQGV